MFNILSVVDATHAGLTYIYKFMTLTCFILQNHITFWRSDIKFSLFSHENQNKIVDQGKEIFFIYLFKYTYLPQEDCVCFLKSAL